MGVVNEGVGVVEGGGGEVRRMFDGGMRGMIVRLAFFFEYGVEIVVVRSF